MRPTISLKLTGAFGVILVLTAALGFFAVSRVGAVRDAVTTASDQIQPATSLIGDMRDATGSYRRNQLLLATGNSDVDEIAAGAKTVSTAIATYRTRYANTPQAERQVEAFAKAWETYLSVTAAAARPGLDTTQTVALISDGDGDAAWDATKEALKDLGAANTNMAEQLARDSVALAAGTRKLTLAILLAVLLVGVSACVLITRSVSGGLRRLVVAARGIAQGDLDQDITAHSRDEMGDAAEAFREMVAYLRDGVATADRIAAGDLTQDVVPRSERDALNVSLRAMLLSLREVLGDVASSATAAASTSKQMADSIQDTGRAVGEIASAMGDVAEGAERQVAAINTTRTVVSRVSEHIERSSQQARESADAADAAMTLAADGVDAVEAATEAMRELELSSDQVSAAMRELAVRSEQIGGIVDTITRIAQQTNLLALNAAIEAAQAGEQGRGFAVVADEVRKLAEESHSAAGRIAGLVKEIQSETHQASAAVERSGDRAHSGATKVDEARVVFQRIGTSVQDMTDRMAQIAEVFQTVVEGTADVELQMGEVTGEVERSSAVTEQVSASTQETSASAHGLSSAADELADTAARLEGVVGRFRLPAEV